MNLHIFNVRTIEIGSGMLSAQLIGCLACELADRSSVSITYSKKLGSAEEAKAWASQGLLGWPV